jgi:hypothetical protein
MLTPTSTMLFHRLSKLVSGPGERMIREHSRWLSCAIRRGAAVPRIPVRRVAEGGFARLMSTPGGRQRAQRWWASALENGDE